MIHSTPVATLARNVTLLTCARVMIVRFVRLRTGLRNADAELERQCRPMPRPGASASVIVPWQIFGDRTRETIAQRIVVGVDLQQAIAADAGEQMRRGKQADAAAEIMRAEGFAGADDVPRDTGTTLRPPHLAISGCTMLKTPSPSACVKPARLAMFSPAASGVRTFFRSNCHSCHGRSARIGSSSQARLYSANDGASSMARSTDQPRLASAASIPLPASSPSAEMARSRTASGIADRHFVATGIEKSRGQV